MVIRNTIYNMLGLGLPLLVAVATMPELIHSLGDARFGVLTLVWAVVSYFGVFDLGLGRAITQQLAVFLSSGRNAEVPALVQTGLAALLVLGVVAGGLMSFGASWGARQIAYDGDLGEIVGAIEVMGLALPFILLTTGFRGILEAQAEFKVLNLIRIPMGLFTFLGPLAVISLLANDLVLITTVLVAGRVLACVAHGYFVARSVPCFWNMRSASKAMLKSLVSSGGWITVSNIVSPLMGYLDRFLIGVCISTAAVAYYVTPNEMITKIWIIPSALTAVLFPRFAAEIAKDDSTSRTLFSQSVLLLFCAVYPLTFFLAIFSNEILTMWVGAKFAEQSTLVMQIFCFGIMVNCLAHIPFSVIQSAGRARLTAMVHLVEFVPFVIVLVAMAYWFGITGAAVAWCLRMLLDTAVMFVLARPILNMRGGLPPSVGLLTGVTCLSYLASMIPSHIARLGVFVCVCGIVSIYIWLYLAPATGLRPKAFQPKAV